MSRRFLRLDPVDDVAVALTDLHPGDRVDVEADEIVIVDNVPFGHKFALRDIAEGAPVVKYGETIGVTKARIAKGAHVHVHNLRSVRTVEV